MTSANAGENATPGEIDKLPAALEEFDCPRCHRPARERFYGPCVRCRAELRGEAPPAAQIASRSDWRALGAGEPPVAHLGELVDRHAGVAELWVTRPALESMGWPLELEILRRRSPHELVELARAAGWEGAREPILRETMAIWRRGGTRVAIVVPAWDRASPFRDAEPAELESALSRFRELVGVPWSYSGGVTSDNLARAHVGRRKPLSRGTVPAPIAELGELEFDFAWARPPAADELEARWAHAFDVNGAYLNATSSLALPAGEWTHFGGPLEIRSREPGIYRLEPPAPLEGWPDPFRPTPAQAELESVWVTTPIALIAAELGHVALEGFVALEHHRYLERWNATLRDARTALLEGGDRHALAAVKAVYKHGIGRFAFDKRTREADRDLEQPIWRELVVGTARMRLYRNLRKLRRPPVAISFDCAWFLSDHESPLECAGELGLPLSDQLGKFKIAGSAPGPAAIAALEHADAWRVAKALREAKA